MILLPIALAAVGAVGLAAGTHLQHRAVSAGADLSGSGARTRLIRSFADPSWLLGTAIIVLSTALNIVALGLAPIALVQPVGALALICAAIISARTLGVRMNRGLVRGIALSGLAVAAFVGVSAGFVRDSAPTEAEASRLAWLLLALVLVGALVARRRVGHMPRVVGAGVLFGAVAATAHVVAGAALTFASAPPAGASSGSAGLSSTPIPIPLLVLLVVLLAAASALGAWLVQSAYASGPPETVLAGLTVLDPLIAVLVGAILLGEYEPLPAVALLGLAASGVAACAGIASIVRHHPAGPGSMGPAPQRKAPRRDASQRDVAPRDVAPRDPDRASAAAPAAGDGAAVPNRRS